MYPKLEKLIRRLHQRTLKGTIHWEETSKPGKFQMAFPGYTINIFTKPNIENPDAIDYQLQIYNDAGNLVEEVSDIDFDDKEYGLKLMSEMYETARRIASGTEQAIDTLLLNLGDADDDIPF
jgi:hypothetical protein